MRFNRYKSVETEIGRFGGGGSIGDSGENKHEASSEEQYFYKENKFRVEKLKQIIAFRNKQIDEHIEDIIKSIKKFDKK
ncbi:ATPase inhibitor mai-2 [Aphis craccivora]|uniref:ATPase inhibitor mai-2 n=1 Tax=Aphis craccivora TaxID=307492 RepID=A0A6G0YC26_APHCR|nr:ATPase inhibitor mai-2 [Aphis craccivora]